MVIVGLDARTEEGNRIVKITESAAEEVKRMGIIALQRLKTMALALLKPIVYHHALTLRLLAINDLVIKATDSLNLHRSSRQFLH